jgi:hypothetical protein
LKHQYNFKKMNKGQISIGIIISATIGATGLILGLFSYNAGRVNSVEKTVTEDVKEIRDDASDKGERLSSLETLVKETIKTTDRRLEAIEKSQTTILEELRKK